MGSPSSHSQAPPPPCQIIAWNGGCASDRYFGEAGRTVFGGQDGAYAVYGGVPPSGIDSITRVVAMTNGQLVYMAFEGTPVASVAQRRPELERIERSFTPEPMR